MPKLGKPKSKRTPVRLRQKIHKASAAKTRKDKKLAKKDPTWRSRLKKDPGIPNLFPYKDRLIHEAEEGKKRKEAEVMARRETAKAQRNGTAVNAAMIEANDDANDDDDDELLDYAEYDDDNDDEDAMDADAPGADDSANPMAALLASARAQAKGFDNEGVPDADSLDDSGSEANDDAATASKPAHRDSSRHAHDKAFKEVISASDVVLYVLDARDPLGTRSRATEHEITASPDRRIILILNKIDLVPPPVLAAWLAHLRRSYPTLPLRAAPSTSAPNAKAFEHKGLTPARTADTLLRALKNWAGARQLKRAVNVGIIGYPNVGKSSVINALTARLGARKTACPVGAEAGVTTAMREVKLDGKIKLLDSPGIVFAGGDASSSSSGSSESRNKRRREQRGAEQARLILLNAIPPHEITDPVPAVTLLLQRLSTQPALFAAMLETYGIPPLQSATKDMTADFLIYVARKRGRLGKGGVPNLHAAAQTVVSDWREGRIQGWCEPPAVEERVEVGKAAQDKGLDALGEGENRKIVSQWAEEFRLDGLWGDHGAKGEVEREGDGDGDGNGDGDGDVAMKV